MVWAWMPGSRNSRYDAPPVLAIDAPNTNANSSTNMIGCTVTSLSISGMRLVWIMLRFTMIQDCSTMVVRRVAGRDASTAGLGATVVMLGPPRSRRLRRDAR